MPLKQKSLPESPPPPYWPGESKIHMKYIEKSKEGYENGTLCPRSPWQK